MQLILTCEHGGNTVPPEHRSRFKGRRKLLESHRGYDPGALELSRRLADRFEAVLIASTTTRLLVDLNRSRHNRTLFSEITRDLSPTQREKVLAQYYGPHWKAVETAVAAGIREQDRVLHLAVHTFTPVLYGKVRQADVGLLYDPERPAERRFCRRWKQEIQRLAPDLRVRRNYPYRGQSDGLTASLRKQFSARQYQGMELEVNQKFPLGQVPGWKRVQDVLMESLHAVIYKETRKLKLEN